MLIPNFEIVEIKELIESEKAHRQEIADCLHEESLKEWDDEILITLAYIKSLKL